MSCPTCDHTMHCVASRADLMDRDVFWCQRCGTVLFGKDHAHAPKLVERVRTFREQFWPNETPPIWTRLGIAESINTPAERT
jgi:Zn-finger nucleic acid-binding protein